MSDNKSSSSSGIGLSGPVFLVFLILKLTHYIDWSWWWITAPLWGTILLIIFVCIIGFIVLIIKELLRG